jgi:hypothetical protein
VVSNTNEYKGYLLGGKGGRYVELTILPLPFANFLEILEGSTSWSPKDLSRPVMDNFTFTEIAKKQ